MAKEPWVLERVLMYWLTAHGCQAMDVEGEGLAVRPRTYDEESWPSGHGCRRECRRRHKRDKRTYAHSHTTLVARCSGTSWRVSFHDAPFDSSVTLPKYMSMCDARLRVWEGIHAGAGAG